MHYDVRLVTVTSALDDSLALGGSSEVGQSLDPCDYRKQIRESRDD